LPDIGRQSLVPIGRVGETVNNRQRIFVDEYLKCFNATKAAILAGYSENTARAIGSENLTKPDIKSEIDARIAESHMSADEALKLMAEQARGDIGDLLDDNGLLDLRLARSKGMTKLLRKIKQKTITHIGKSDNDDDTEIVEIEFEMYDAQAAQDKILRVAGKYVNRTELTGKDGKDLPAAVISVYLPDNARSN
jgi:phage terminase small subunit